MSGQLVLTGAEGLPVGCGVSIECADSPGSYYVQTPDHLWALMIARLKKQVGERERAMSRWESRQPEGARTSGSRYWDAYRAAKATHRVDYPMPWGHVMFEGRTL